MIKKIKSLLSEKPFWIASVCVLLLTSLIISGALLAKYVHSNRSDIVAGSPNFYFNSDYLTEEIDGIIAALTAYRDAMAAGDAEKLKELLREGRLAKERVDRGSEDDK